MVASSVYGVESCGVESCEERSAAFDGKRPRRDEEDKKGC